MAQHGRQTSGVGPAVAALCIGLALLWLAPPRMIASFSGLAAQPVIAQLRAGEPVRPRDIAIAIESQTAATAWIDDGSGWADLELLEEAMVAPGGGVNAGAGPTAEQAIDLQRRSLALSPAHSYVWTRLARAELLRHGPGPRLAPMLELAITTAPFDRRLALQRLELCLLAWRHIDTRLRTLVNDQARFAARLSTRRLAEMTKRRYATAIVRAALAPDPELRRKLDAALVRL
jgi:hypothetical protein